MPFIDPVPLIDPVPFIRPAITIIATPTTMWCGSRACAGRHGTVVPRHVARLRRVTRNSQVPATHAVVAAKNVTSAREGRPSGITIAVIPTAVESWTVSPARLVSVHPGTDGSAGARSASNRAPDRAASARSTAAQDQPATG